ncbi:MAG TPA: metal ABC transporter substrate-binding protein [Verrucomicrobiae bacterium]
MKKLIFVYLAFALALIGNAAEKKLNVVCTLPDLAAVTDAVGAQYINMSCLAGPSEDPHFVDPRPSFVKLLNKADLLIEGGVELEIGWLPPLVQNARNSRILVGQAGHLNCAEQVNIKERPTGPVDRSQGDVHPLGNPHYMMDPLNAVIVAQHIAERLRQLDGAHAEVYKQNAQKFADQIKTQLPEWQKTMEPVKGEKVITYHKSFPYFIERFGLEFFDALEPKPGIEPSPSHIAELIKRGKEAGIKLILIEENRPKKTPERVAQEIGAKVVVLHHMPENSGRDRYVTWIRGMVEAVANAAKSP